MCWTEWWKKEGSPHGQPHSLYRAPIAIGDGAGFLFNMFDVDGDGDLDVLAPQFFIQNSGTLVVKGPADIRGDSLIWFENPGTAGAVTHPGTAIQLTTGTHRRTPWAKTWR